MGADTKALRNRIKSVDSTLHLTKAMGLVAASKIRRANAEMLKTKAYADGLAALMKQLLSCRECAQSVYAAQRGTRTKLVVIAGDRGLAGGYNANVFRLLRDYPDTDVIPLGKRACERFASPTVSSERFSAAQAYDLAKELCEQFKAGVFDRLGIVYTRYESMMTQTATVRWVFPLVPDDSVKTVSAVFEPDEATILETAVPEYVTGLLCACVRESFASEVAARRMAMDSAGKNATAMINDLQLKYNRARQGAITQEITEIVAGSGEGKE